MNYATMIAEHPKPWCWICGRDERQVPHDWHASWYLQRAHLAAGSGCMVRKEDVRLVVISCPRCHALHRHRDTGPIRLNGRPYPPITDANMMWVKRERDPEQFDMAFIAQHWYGGMPDPAPPAKPFLDGYSLRRWTRRCIAA